MRDLPRRWCFLAGRYAIGLAVCLAAPDPFEGAAWAQGYPDRSVKIIVPFPAGGTADAIPRIVADWPIVQRPTAIRCSRRRHRHS